jgi:hypothetical protein
MPAATGRAAFVAVGRGHEHERGRRGGRVEAGQAGLAAGPRSGVAARLRKKILFLIIFQLKQHKTLFLSKIKTFIWFGAKIKVAQNFVIFNFAKKRKVKIQIDFELGI